MIPVVFSSDHNFIMPTYVAISSMLAKASRACGIYLLVADDVTDEDKRILKELAEKYGSAIEFIPVGNVFDDTFCVRGITKATYFRLLIPWLLPQHDKVIYLDGDIVVTGDIAELYDISLGEGNLIGGVRTPGFSTNRKIRKEIENNGLNYREYINAGILIFNNDLLRKENFKPIFLSHIDKKYSFQDQDILNITCKGRICFLPLKFNYTGTIKPDIIDMFVSMGLATQEEITDAVASPVIIHYAGAKPWREFTSRWCDWVNHYRSTPFYSQKLIDGISSKVLYPAFSLKKTIKMLIKRY